MATITTTCDVFLSHAAAESSVAAMIAKSLEQVGLTTFYAGTVDPAGDLGDEIWSALAESRAMIAIVSSAMPLHALGLVEIGAAAAWNKPVFVIINGPSTLKLPLPLAKYPVYPLSRLDEVIREIRAGFQPLSIDERDLLAEVYLKQGLPADQFSQTPMALRDLTTVFNRRAKKQFSGERLLSELIRMRKQGSLPRLR